ncbi:MULTISPECIES: class I adenylate-forming enzyme family protein [Mumia]|uniref:Class I adenylate-forming enzyme family protein n=1 Tax=Mumia xiangluensis TaxID=1678900 RepID=A0ABW1QK23_9ACTN|nr:MULTISPECIES: class I adenylate-forming enzyme family protein [Mumia]
MSARTETPSPPVSATELDVREALLAPGAPYELVETVAGGRTVRVYRHAPASLRAVLEGVRAHGDRDALVYEAERLTYHDLYTQVATLAHVLRDDLGVTKGDRVAIAMRNVPELVITFWAAHALGAIAVPLNAWWTGSELQWAVEDCAPAVLVADGERWKRLRTAAGSDDALPTTVVTRTDEAVPAPHRRWDRLLASAPSYDALPPCDVEPDDPATIIYTSGTTGRPKGALATHRNHTTLMMTVGFQAEVGRQIAGDDAVAPTPTAQPAMLNPFPLFHIGGVSSVYNAAAGGMKMVLMYRWDTDEALGLCVREEITALVLVPTMLRRLLTSPALPAYDLSRVSSIGIGGSPGATELVDLVLRRVGPQVSINHGYGMTETTSSAVQQSGAAVRANPQVAGLPVPGAEVKLVDDSGSEVATGEVGEVWVRGPQVVAGYWTPGETESAFSDGWFHSGDLGVFDAAGRLRLVDRLKDVVIRGGENVYPAEVERVLGAHPDVAEVAVVAVPDPDLGEAVAAVVVPHEGEQVDVDALRTLASAELAAFKVPSVWHVRHAPLPRNPSGKVLKRDVRDWASAAR